MTSTNWPLLQPYVMVPLQVMSIINERNSVTGNQRGMLVSVEATLARAKGLEPVLFMLLPDDDANTTIELDPAYDGWDQYSFLNTVARPSAVLAPHWSNYFTLGQLCPSFCPPMRPAYSYCSARRTCVTGMGIGYGTALTGMFFGLGYALAWDDPFYDYYYSYPGLMFYEGYGYYDPLLYDIGLTGALILTEAALLGGAVGLGIGLGVGLIAGLEIACFAAAWSDPFYYGGPGLMIMEPGCFVYGGGGMMFEGGYGGYCGVDGGFAVASYDGGFVPGDGYVDAPYVDNGFLPDPGSAYSDFGGTGYDASTGTIDPSVGGGGDPDFAGGDNSFQQPGGDQTLPETNDRDFGGGDNDQVQQPFDDGQQQDYDNTPDQDFGGGDNDFGGGDDN